MSHCFSKVSQVIKNSVFNKKNNNKIFLQILLLGLILSSNAEMVQPIRTVDAQTAGLIDRASYTLESRIYSPSNPRLGSGIIIGTTLGLTNRLNLGINYGGEGIVGYGREAQFLPYPGFLIKYRLFEESFKVPGVAIGYIHSGFDSYDDTACFKLGNIKSNVFASVSKNYLLFNVIQFGMHGSLVYTIKQKDVYWPNAFAGLDIGFNDELSLVLEYDFAFTERDPVRKDEPNYYARPQDGYANAGVRWAFADNFQIEFDARDIFEVKKVDNERVGWSRELKFVYFTKF